MGEISVKSEVGHGTTFTVKLPKHQKMKSKAKLSASV
jgi:signal transduction histidine kinase